MNTNLTHHDSEHGKVLRQVASPALADVRHLLATRAPQRLRIAHRIHAIQHFADAIMAGGVAAAGDDARHKLALLIVTIELEADGALGIFLRKHRRSAGPACSQCVSSLIDD